MILRFVELLCSSGDAVELLPGGVKLDDSIGSVLRAAELACTFLEEHAYGLVVESTLFEILALEAAGLTSNCPRTKHYRDSRALRLTRVTNANA